MYKELKGKCKEYIDKELCLGCERLDGDERNERIRFNR